MILAGIISKQILIDWFASHSWDWCIVLQIDGG